MLCLARKQQENLEPPAQQEEVRLLLKELFPQSRPLSGKVIRLDEKPFFDAEADLSQARSHLPIIERQLLEVMDQICPMPTLAQAGSQSGPDSQEYDPLPAIMARISHHIELLSSHVGELRENLRQAMMDTLTGLPNRAAFEDRLAGEIQRVTPGLSECALLVWDIDYFKEVNDTWGHLAGDEVLRAVGQEITKSVRHEDFAVRYGGEEFAVLRPGTSSTRALNEAERLRRAIETMRVEIEGQRITVTASCGLTLLSATDTQMSAFARADAALYHAKQAGRNRCHLA